MTEDDPDTQKPWWCATCESWRFTQPCGRDECPQPEADRDSLRDYATHADYISRPVRCQVHGDVHIVRHVTPKSCGYFPAHYVCNECYLAESGKRKAAGA
jgi:hypothetical protein